jgi:hypothetical protein
MTSHSKYSTPYERERSLPATPGEIVQASIDRIKDGFKAPITQPIECYRHVMSNYHRLTKFSDVVSDGVLPFVVPAVAGAASFLATSSQGVAAAVMAGGLGGSLWFTPRPRAMVSAALGFSRGLLTAAVAIPSSAAEMMLNLARQTGAALTDQIKPRRFGDLQRSDRLNAYLKPAPQ